MLNLRRREIASRGSTATVRILGMIGAFSKVTSLGRDSLLVVVLGFSSQADSVQIGLAFGGTVGGVLGTSVALAITPTVAAAPRARALRITHQMTYVLASFVLVAFIAIAATQASIFDEVAKTYLTLGSAGLFDAAAVIAIAVAQGRMDFAVPALVVALNGTLFCVIVGGSLLLGQKISLNMLALVIALESGLIAIVLLTRLLSAPAPQTRAPTTDEVEESAGPAFRRRLVGAASSYSLISVAIILSRSLAAGVPGGAALLALAQRVVGVAASLILQPMHSVVTPWLTQAADRASVRAVINRFLFAFTSLAASVALLFAVPWFAFSASTQDAPVIAATLLLAVAAANFMGFGLRQWLLEGRRAVIAVAYVIYVAPFVVLAFTHIRGPGAVAQVELLAQCLLVLFAFQKSSWLSGTPGHRPVATFIAAGALPLAGLLVVVQPPTPVLFGLAAMMVVASVRHSGSVVRIMQDLSPRRPW